MISAFFNKYFNQAAALPFEVKAMLAESLAGEQICAYAFVDLDENFFFNKIWVVVTKCHIVLARPNNKSATWNLQTIYLSDVHKFHIIEGRSVRQLLLIDKNEKVLTKLFYTRRQNRSMSRLQFVALNRQAILHGRHEQIMDKHSSADEDYQESILHNLHQNEAMFFVPSINVIFRLLGYLKPYKKVVILGVFLGAVITSLQLLPPYLIRVLIDYILKPIESGKIADASVYLWLVIGGLALTWMLSELGSFFRLRIMSHTGEKVTAQLRQDLFDHLQSLDLSFFSKHPSGSLIARTSFETDKILEFFTFGIVDMIISMMQVIGVSLALLFQDWFLASLVLVPLPVIGMVFYLQGKKTQSLYTRIWRKWSAITAILSDVIPGIRIVQAFAQEKYEHKRFCEKNKALKEELVALHNQWSKFWPTVSMLMHICSIIVWIIGAPQVILYVQTDGVKGLPLGVFIAFTSYLWIFWHPIQQLGIQSRSVNRVISAASRIFEILDTSPMIFNKSGAVHLNPIKGSVSFESVTFSYDGIHNAVENVTFNVNAGEMIGIIGPSGSGKTTLVNLICRFYDADTGLVKIDGIDIRNLDLKNLRQQIGLVQQEPYLVQGTIAENIAYGLREATPKNIIDAAKSANAHEFICDLPDGYETIIGEGGQSLSGGQRQRVSIARAILHNPRILILDEATSSVDSENEKKIQGALENLIVGRTTFVIAHRLSTLLKADKLFIIESGKLKEQGSHNELLQKTNSFYAQMFRMQTQSISEVATNEY